MTINSKDIMDAVASHALASGYFDRVGTHEPKNAPGNGLSASVVVKSLQPIAGRSGLAVTSALLVLTVHLHSNMLQEPQDSIDPNLVGAADALMIAYSGDFNLNGQISEVDLLGQYGPGLGMESGYQTVDKTLYRLMTITLPCVINDAWPQSA